MPLKKLLLILPVMFLLGACSNSGSSDSTTSVSGGGDSGGSSGGGGISTGGSGTAGPLELNIDNIRSIEDVVQRLNMISSEVMRSLKPYLYPRVPDASAADSLDPVDRVLPYLFTTGGGFTNPLNVDQLFADASTNPPPLPSDPFLIDACWIEADPNDQLDGVYGVEFRDVDFSGSLTQGDQMVFSYSQQGCDLSADVNYERAPSELAGIMTVTFGAGSDVAPGSDPRRLVGTVSFLDYEYKNGVLAWRSGDSETITSGSANFDITLSPQLTTANGQDAVADVSDFRLTAGSFILESGSATLGGPIVLTFDEVRRQVYAAGDPIPAGGTYALGDYTLFLDNVEVESQSDGASLVFYTRGYPDPAVDNVLTGDFNEYPHSGSIFIEGGNDTFGQIPSQPNADRLTVAQVDADDNDTNPTDTFELFRVTSWDFLLGQFLVPGDETFTETADD